MKRSDGLGRIQQHVAVLGNPIATESPEYFQEVGDEAFVLFALPHESPPSAALCPGRHGIQVVKGVRRRWHQIGPVIEHACICKCGDSIEMSLIDARIKICGKKLIPFLSTPPIAQVEQPTGGSKLRHPDDVAVD